MVELPRLALDIAVPPNALARRGGVTISEDIILTFLQVRKIIFFSIVYYLLEYFNNYEYISHSILYASSKSARYKLHYSITILMHRKYKKIYFILNSYFL